MNQNLTSINIILDSSGSMGSCLLATLEGFNSFIAEQKLQPGEAALTLYTFSSSNKLIHDNVPIAQVPNLTSETYNPSGGTLLVDTLANVINTVGERLSKTPEEDRPSKVLFLIISDGQDNLSQDYTKQQIKDMVAHQQEKYSWNFIYMGGDLDAIAEGTSLGIGAANSYNYSADPFGTKSLYRNVSQGVSNYRGGQNFTIDPKVLIK